jgi:hypothetical protein
MKCEIYKKNEATKETKSGAKVCTFCTVLYLHDAPKNLKDVETPKTEVKK